MTDIIELRSIRTSIAYVTFLLIMLGVVMVYSSSAIYAGQTYGDHFFFLKKHLITAVIGFFCTILVMSVDMEILKKYSKYILIFSIGLLVAILIPGIGKTAGGAKRWIDIGILNIQPSEIARLALILYFADLMERKQARISNFLHGFLPPMIILSVIMLLVMAEPDLGTTVSIGFVGFIILFISGARLSHLGSTLLGAIPILWYVIFSSDYRRRRILAFLNPWGDEKGTGFQIVQSFIALGSGGLFGLGLGQSKQKLFFLPASHTDFIMSIIGEELGFVGTASVILLFMILIWQGASAAFRIQDVFRRTLIFGIIFSIAFEVLVNLGVSCGLLPTKGLPLPFISYGGTSLVIHMVSIGLLLNAAKE